MESKKKPQTLHFLPTVKQNILTHKKLQDELSLVEAALALSLNGWGDFELSIQSEINSANEQIQITRDGTPDLSFASYYSSLLSACLDGEINIANKNRLDVDPIPEQLVVIKIDDLVDWIRHNKIFGQGFVPSSLAERCSFHEQFTFYTPDMKNDEQEGAEAKPTQMLALHNDLARTTDCDDVTQLKYLLRQAEKENEALKMQIDKLHEYESGEKPSKKSILRVIAGLRHLILKGRDGKGGDFKTQDELSHYLIDKIGEKQSMPSKRTIDSIFSNANKLCPSRTK
ncbi:hypothetical protein BS007_RS17105 [Vibrio parahaemolyticus]|nr:hypothetical protein [Vibrio parahaemolyticus]HCG9703128.1 hypothetical protein [Vibrio parahaemolyticus]